MPTIHVEYNDDEHAKLQEEYIKMSIVWPQLGHKDLPPTFESWVGARAVQGDGTSIALEVEDMQQYNAIERLLNNLELHDIGLTHLSKDEALADEAVLQLANALVNELKLQPQYVRRLQNLIAQNMKSPQEVSDSARIGVTSRTHVALEAAYRKLIERTEKAVQHLGEDRAVGRVEGAGAILASLHIIDRNAAEEKTEEFKLQVRAASKPNWVGKVFGRAAVQEAVKK